MDYYAVLDVYYVNEDSYANSSRCAVAAGERRSVMVAAVWCHAAAGWLLEPDLRNAAERGPEQRASAVML